VPDMTATLDITREVCPMTYVRTKLKLESLPPDALLEVLLKGDEPVKNVPRSARDEGHDVVSLEPRGDGTHRLVIRKRGA
jgi:tRNA 2-thiouridine synthesizing protein A